MLACLWFILAFYCGALILPASGLKLRSFEYVPASLLSGLVLLLVTTGAASWAFAGVTLPAIYGGAGLGGLLAILIARRFRISLPTTNGAAKPWLYGLGWTALLTPAFAKVIQLRPEGLFSNVPTDLPVHLAMIHAFLDAPNFPPNHPLFAGEPLIYPFGINFLSAIVMRLGLPLDTAMVVPGLLLILCLTLLIFGTTQRLTRSWAAAYWAPPLLFLSGGLGILVYLGIDLPSHGWNPWQTLLEARPSYTDAYPFGLQWYNMVRSFLLPQRSMLLGLPLVWLILLLIDQGLAQRRWQALLTAGLLTGSLPWLHTHSLIALGLVLPLWTLIKWQRHWWGFWSGLALTGIPSFFWLRTGHADRSFLFRPIDGWSGWAGDLPWGLFWILNGGMILGLLGFGLLNRRAPGSLRAWSAPVLLLWILPNLFLFAPHEGDNMKILILAYNLSIPLLAWGLAAMGTRSRSLTAGVAMLLLGAGSLDVTRLSFSDRAIYQLFSEQDLVTAAAVRNALEPGAILIHAPQHHHYAALTGRPSLLAAPIYAASYGLHPREREADLKSLYSTNCSLVRPTLQARYADRPYYLLWGSREKDYFKIRQPCLIQMYPAIYTQSDLRIYRIFEPQKKPTFSPYVPNPVIAPMP
jgi:hypothetical protein